MAGRAEAPRRESAPERTSQEELLAVMPPRSASREVRVGIFVLLGLFAFFAALFTFTDVGTFRGRYYLNTVVQNAGGMRNGDPVQMRGVNIGRVVNFQMVPGGVGVRMEIEDKYRVPENSRAEIGSSGLLGGMVVNVIPGPSSNPAESGDTLPGSSAPGIMGTAAALGTKADTVLARANALLSPSTTGAVNQSAQQLQTLLTELTALAVEQRKELAAIEADLRQSAANTQTATAAVARLTSGPELQRSVQHIDSLTARLDETTVSLNQASTSLATLVNGINSGQGTLGKLTTDDALYQNLTAAANNLNALVADIKANPKRYINVRVF
ncbi:MAG TPA: MlaD family protein [Longimicrobiaceae bacterium]|nr:MlaD family protein [Longimicrobiaceae bacterium]